MVVNGSIGHRPPPWEPPWAYVVRALCARYFAMFLTMGPNFACTLSPPDHHARGLGHLVLPYEQAGGLPVLCPPSKPHSAIGLFVFPSHMGLAAISPGHIACDTRRALARRWCCGARDRVLSSHSTGPLATLLDDFLTQDIPHFSVGHHHDVLTQVIHQLSRRLRPASLCPRLLFYGPLLGPPP